MLQYFCCYNVKFMNNEGFKLKLEPRLDSLVCKLFLGHGSLVLPSVLISQACAVNMNTMLIFPLTSPVPVVFPDFHLLFGFALGCH